MPNSDLISRAAAMDAFMSKPPEYYHSSYIVGELNCVPAVDAAPVVHGRWIEIEDSWGDCHYQCTECGEEWNLDAGTPAENNMNYCPNCGAKLDEEVAERGEQDEDRLV